ncbi:unnamed protein product [Amoebophrya sp. A25]|nr:unnamed protein product [Amoebophrya sp. A25]|eukprot:GSA25T00016086001.1
MQKCGCLVGKAHYLSRWGWRGRYLNGLCGHDREKRDGLVGRWDLFFQRRRSFAWRKGFDFLMRMMHGDSSLWGSVATAGLSKEAVEGLRCTFEHAVWIMGMRHCQW